MNQNRTQQNLLLLFLLLSLLIHLLLVFLSKQLTLFPDADKPDRVYVQMRSRDLDMPVRPELEKPREKPAKRLGPADQVVEKEMAPKGDSLEDMRPNAAAPPAPEAKPKVVPPQPAKAEPKVEPRPEGKRPRVEKQVETTETQQPKAEEKVEPNEQAEPLQDINSLLQLPQETTTRIDKNWRRKQRDDVAVGDEVWLDSEYDLLTSFFQRLRSGIYRVWNYPAKSAREGRQGSSLLSMTFRHDGSIKEVKLLKSSGTRILDRAAVAAVRKGGPYGKLPEVYDKDELTIKAWFRYDLRKSRTRGAGLFGQ